jgi:hypothetical protein
MRILFVHARPHPPERQSGADLTTPSRAPRSARLA